MALTNPNDIVTEERLSEFYQGILPYLGAVHGSPPPKPTIYGMRILRDESVPSAKVVYLEDNAEFEPAHMNFTNGTFNYGSWENAFFMPKPCMLKYDGTVDYYLDPNDYTKKEDGTASDVANTSYEGNAMMEWPKIWLKIVPDATKDNKQADIFISNVKVDNGYHDWASHNSNGMSSDYFYTAIYSGVLIGDNLRSISGVQPSSSLTMQQEIDYAFGNNVSNSVIWNIETLSDSELINLLLMLIGKTTNPQSFCGLGLYYASGNYPTGSMNDKGLFYGHSSDYSVPSKVFGIENWWGFKLRRYVGEIMIDGVRKRKLTYGMEDGSTVIGYNLTGNGYITSGASISGTSSGYITEMLFSNVGMLPVTNSGGSSSTYYPDLLRYSSSGTFPATRGGGEQGRYEIGPFRTDFLDSSNTKSYLYNSSLSAHPVNIDWNPYNVNHFLTGYTNASTPYSYTVIITEAGNYFVFVNASGYSRSSSISSTGTEKYYNTYAADSNRATKVGIYNCSEGDTITVTLDAQKDQYNVCYSIIVNMKIDFSTISLESGVSNVESRSTSLSTSVVGKKFGFSSFQCNNDDSNHYTSYTSSTGNDECYKYNIVKDNKFSKSLFVKDEVKSSNETLSLSAYNVSGYGTSTVLIFSYS